MNSWANAYIGTPYVAQTGDCAAFVQRVAREVLHLDVELPGHATGLRAQALQFDALKTKYAERVEKPVEAHPVLFMARRKFYHMGAVVLSGGEVWVAHASMAAGAVVCEPLRNMTAWNFQFEGFYSWRQRI